MPAMDSNLPRILTTRKTGNVFSRESHATVGKRKRVEVDQAIAEIERQVKHSLVCRAI